MIKMIIIVTKEIGIDMTISETEDTRGIGMTEEKEGQIEETEVLREETGVQKEGAIMSLDLKMSLGLLI